MISVCIPTYNGEKYIKEQLESILVQLSSDDEIIISDDRSSDNTLSLIKSFNDKRIKIFIHDKALNHNKGTYSNIYCVYKNVENTLAHATGDYIFLSDQDDIWLPNKVERVMQEFNNGAQCVSHNSTVVDRQLNVLRESYFLFSQPSNGIIRFIAFPSILGASMAFTRAIRDNSLSFPNKYIVAHEHWIACVVRANDKRVILIDEPLILYRRHGGNVSSSSQKSSNGLYYKISYRFNMVINLLRVKSRTSR